jgi:hypothetical protein
MLDVDSTWTLLARKGVDAKHLDTRRFQIEKICRGLKVFPQIVGCGMIRRFLDWVHRADQLRGRLRALSSSSSA